MLRAHRGHVDFGGWGFWSAEVEAFEGRGDVAELEFVDVGQLFADDVDFVSIGCAADAAGEQVLGIGSEKWGPAGHRGRWLGGRHRFVRPFWLRLRIPSGCRGNAGWRF